MAKSRVTPIKQMTIPRLELAAALVSVRMSALLRGELDYVNITEWFWTDSNVILGYIFNDARRFHVFVANRVQQIRDQTETSQWNYVSSVDNPADIASRGVTACDLVNNSLWFHGPTFLWESNLPYTPQTVVKPPLSEKDPEVKHCGTLATTAVKTDQDSLLNCVQRYSDWTKAKRVIALCLQFRSKSKPVRSDATFVTDLRNAETALIRLLQHKTFSSEIMTLTSACGTTVKRNSPLHKLDPFLDENGILRVGGRIRKGDFLTDVKHPIILPRKSHITELIIRHFHERTRHQGRCMTTNEIRSNGYWILGCSSAVFSFISKCIKCRKRRNQSRDQKMSDLPLDRLAVEPPFTYSGVDYFGPFLIKEGRKELKRYGVIFTCMSSRAIHLETANSLDTSSFINSLRRFLSIRGPIRQLRSDRGTNFVGAKRELKEALEGMDDNRLKEYLSGEGCDYILFRMNVPSASHMGGVWERQIRTVRSVLSSIMEDFGSQLDDETLRTFLCETMAIVNSRPLTITNLNDPLSLEPLTPNHLLTMKSKILLPPPGEFQKPDLYCRRRWRRVQYLANEFWNRWRKEYLQTLQMRTKWSSPRRNFHVGDVVLIMDDNLPRNQWRLGRVTVVNVQDDGFMRSVKLTIGDRTLDKRGRRNGPLSEIERPIHKLVLLIESDSETGEIPTEEPSCDS